MLGKNTTSQFLNTIIYACLLVTASCTNNSPANEKISLAQEPSLGNGIYRIDGIDWGSGLIWSPDGKYIARLHRELPMPDCWTCGDSYSEIFIVNTEDWKKQIVLRTEYITKDIETISWLPDSEHIAYVPSAKSSGDPTQIWSIGIDGQNDMMIIQENGKPTWSSDGSKVALLDTQRISGGLISYIYVINTLTGEKLLAFKSEEPNLVISHLSWRLDSKIIAFSYGKRQDIYNLFEDVFLLNIESNDIVQVTDDQFDYWRPEFSPFRNLIAIQKSDKVRDNKSPTFKTLIMDLEQNCEVELPIPETYSASWSSDGQKIAITSLNGDYIVDLTNFIGAKFAEAGSICP